MADVAVDKTLVKILQDAVLIKSKHIKGLTPAKKIIVHVVDEDNDHKLLLPMNHGLRQLDMYIYMMNTI